MKKNTAKDYAAALFEATEKTTGDTLKKTVAEFARILFKNQQLKQSDKIISEFIKYAKKQSGVTDIEITAARKLEAATLKEIKGHFGGQVEVVEKIDKELIGGFVVKTEDKIFDGSLKTQLSKLKQSLG